MSQRVNRLHCGLLVVTSGRIDLQIKTYRESNMKKYLERFLNTIHFVTGTLVLNK